MAGLLTHCTPHLSQWRPPVKAAHKIHSLYCKSLLSSPVHPSCLEHVQPGVHAPLLQLLYCEGPAEPGLEGGGALSQDCMRCMLPPQVGCTQHRHLHGRSTDFVAPPCWQGPKAQLGDTAMLDSTTTDHFWCAA